MKKILIPVTALSVLSFTTPAVKTLIDGTSSHADFNYVKAPSLNQNLTTNLHTTKIRNLFTENGKNIFVPSTGNPEANRLSEDRQLTHSGLIPTGIFANFRSTIIVTPKKGSVIKNGYIFVGQIGDYANINNGKVKKMMKFKLKETGPTKVNFPISGMVYLANFANEGTNDWTIESVKTKQQKDTTYVPTFFKDYTLANDFYRQVMTTDSPFVELVSEHIFATMQTKVMRNVFKNSKNITALNKHLQEWDKVWHWTNEVYGLSEQVSGINHKHQEYIHIANPDTGGGYASATNGAIKFQVKSGSGFNLFNCDDETNWSLWHEIGHTYQNMQYTSGFITETTVNISCLYIQEQYSQKLRLQKDGPIDKTIKFFNLPDSQKNYLTLDNHQQNTKLMLFGQLFWAFGDEFYPKVNQYYRAHPTIISKSASAADKMNEFVYVTSKVTFVNLLPFFEHWGFHFSTWTKIKYDLSHMWLQHDIWNNFINHTNKPITNWWWK